jgi:ribose/xylose/arabinose/galactoside ABC-type transport system permease subunit
VNEALSAALTSPSQVARGRFRHLWERVVSGRIITLLCLIVVTGAVFGYMAPHFLSTPSLINICRQATVLGIVALGATFVIIAGEIDLSVGAVVALVSVLVAWAFRMGYPVSVALLMGLVAGLVIGSVNGWLSLTLRVPSFLATLGTLSVVKGIAMTITLEPVPLRSIPFIKFFMTSPWRIPMPVIIAIVLFVVSALILNFSRFGIRTRAVGSNESAARLAGLNTTRQKYLVFVLGSVFAAVGGVVLAGRTNYGMSQAAGGLELEVIAAIILGGARLGGGIGSVTGTLLSSLLLTMIFMGIATVGLPGPYQDVAKGAAIGLAVLLMKR